MQGRGTVPGEVHLQHNSIQKLPNPRSHPPSVRPRKNRAAINPWKDVTRPSNKFQCCDHSLLYTVNSPCKVVTIPQANTIAGRSTFGPTRCLRHQQRRHGTRCYNLTLSTRLEGSSIKMYGLTRSISIRPRESDKMCRIHVSDRKSDTILKIQSCISHCACDGSRQTTHTCLSVIPSSFCKPATRALLMFERSCAPASVSIVTSRNETSSGCKAEPGTHQE